MRKSFRAALRQAVWKERLKSPILAPSLVNTYKINGDSLKYKEIIKRPAKITEKVIKIRKKYIPPADHPWRQTFKKYFKHKTLQTADEK